MHADAYKETPRVANGTSSGIIWIVATVIVGIGVFAAILLATQRKEYSQATPEDVLASAIQMVKDGNTDRLSDLIYADNVEYRSTLTRLGHLFGTMQGLGTVMARVFPSEVAAARDRLKQELEGKGEGIATALMTAGPDRPLRFNQPKTVEEQREREQQFQDFTTRLFADPFGWLESGAARLGVERIADDAAVVKFDKSPILGGVLTIRKYDDRWWFVLPLNLPGVNQYAPQTRNEWAIVASLVKVIDNALGELRDDVAAGKAATVQRVSEMAGEKAFIPAAVVFVMYGKEMDVRSRRENAMKAFRKRWGDYTKARSEDHGTLRTLTDAAAKSAVEGLDQLIRKRTADKNAPPIPKFDAMPDPELVALTQGWLRDAGATINLSQPITEAAAKDALAKIDAKSKSGIRSRPAPLVKK
ncbi:MAG: hypothetical protein K2Q09_05690 [Phycisphaerales bacterium]|nr:hypothetical protein [Phycisphaerales bacterium]